MIMRRLEMRAMMALVVAGFLIAPSLAVAQSGDSVSFKKKTIIDFSDVLIEGELTKPEGSYVVSRKLSRFSTLIQYRQDYKYELLDSANDL
ncbi:MAG: hypothetical protein A2289_16615 [Deltaproteobacteria bacterium RIFOXYA12_FULL_58_15]|nr:MAG: hypothetical protein A2289_16615 [Deltaproteobacteria bacterium RIFOXYA12_FULL_58_15]OGR10960.1 MAG: hypothetical protein A2341_11270 [Deltaproteobacteria bacterium RIFOXYB12_FULL_58_9]